MDLPKYDWDEYIQLDLDINSSMDSFLDGLEFGEDDIIPPPSSLPLPSFIDISNDNTRGMEILPGDRPDQNKWQYCSWPNEFIFRGSISKLSHEQAIQKNRLRIRKLITYTRSPCIDACIYAAYTGDNDWLTRLQFIAKHKIKMNTVSNHYIFRDATRPHICASKSQTVDIRRRFVSSSRVDRQFRINPFHVRVFFCFLSFLYQYIYHL